MTALPNLSVEEPMTFHLDQVRLDKATQDLDAMLVRSSSLMVLREVAPAWSPFAKHAELPGSTAIIYPAAFFADLLIRVPSPTQMRRLNARIAKARLRDCAPDWLPAGGFGPLDVAHLFALAASIGAYALLDLNDLIGQDRWLLNTIGTAALDYRDTYKPFSRKQMGYAVDGACGFIGSPSFEHFFDVLTNPEAMNTPFGHAVFDYVVDGVGSDMLESAARRVMKSDSPRFARAARRFLNIPDPIAIAAPDASKAPAVAAPSTPLPEAASAPLPRPTSAPPAAPKWIPPIAPDGVILTQRALRELRSERLWPVERLDAALAALAAYREMKLGRLTLAAYNEHLAAARLADHLCFADAGTLKAFASDYSVMHNGRKYTLDRHIKWGRGSTPITCMRVYYTWDSERSEIIVGSMPRHLPTKRG